MDVRFVNNHGIVYQNKKKKTLNQPKDIRRGVSVAGLPAFTAAPQLRLTWKGRMLCDENPKEEENPKDEKPKVKIKKVKIQDRQKKA